MEGGEEAVRIWVLVFFLVGFLGSVFFFGRLY